MRTVLVITAANLAKKCSTKTLQNQMMLRFGHNFKLWKIFPVEYFLSINSVNCKEES